MSARDQKDDSCRMTTTHITFTGIYGEMRRRGKEYVERLKAVYDGCLVLGVTTHVVCDPTRIAGSAPSEKLLLAVEAGIPVLSFRWLEQCAQAGRWLPLEGYTIALRAMHPATGFASEPEAVLEERCEIIEDREPTANGKSSKSGSDIVIEDDDVTAFRDAAGCFVGCSIEIHQNVNLNRNQDADRSNRATCEQDEHVVESRRRSNAAAEQNSASVPPTSPSLSPTHLRLTYSCPRAESSRVEALPNMIKVSTDAPRSPPPAAAIFQPMVSVNLKAGPLFKASERWLSRKIQSIEAHHGVTLQPEQVKFYEIATVSNTANEAQKKVILKSSPDQGVSLLYDVDKVSGKKTFARALITCIYSLEIATDHSELWMEHHYLFGRADFQERPDWKLPQGTPRDGELLVSTGIYHSPLNLVVGDFGILFSNINGHKDKKFVGEPWKFDCFPVYLCRKAFDVSTKKCIPLKKANLDIDITF